jgi:lysylphosphatidylglycerol synthase-like protein
MSHRHRWYLPLAALTGVALFGYTVMSVGLRELGTQMWTLAPVLPLILGLAAIRFLLQAAGWRAAINATTRPTWREVFSAVVAGEAAGYFAWGPVTREPMKALFVSHVVPKRTALTAAMFERLVYSIVATVLIVAAIAIAAMRYHFVGRFLFGSGVVVGAALTATRYWKRVGSDLKRHRSSLAAMATYAAAQELSNLAEAYLVLAWLGATPTVTAIVVLEGIGRLMNSAGQFIPGKLGVTEAATAALADGLRLGSAHGLSLALARRIRSLVWGAVGISLVALRAFNCQVFINHAIQYIRRRGAALAVPPGGLLQ